MTTSTLTLTLRTAGRRELSAKTAFVVAAYLVGLTQLASVAPAPLYGTYARLWHFSSLTLTLIYATYAFGVLAVLILAGRISDEVGRRPVLLVAIGALMAAVAVFTFADSAVWLFVARGLQGLATGAALGTASAALLDLHWRQDASAVGIVTAASATFGLGLGVLTTSIIVQIGWEPRVLPYVLLLMLLAVAAAGVWSMPETVANRRRLRLTIARPAVPASVRRPFALSALAALASWSLGGLFFSLGPALGAHVFHSHNVVLASVGVVAVAFTAAVSQVAFGRLAPWLDLSAGAAVLSIGTLAIVLATATESSVLFLAGSVATGAGWGLAFLGGLRALSSAIPPEHRASVLSAFYVVAYAALSIPAILAGALVDRLGLETTFEWFGIVVALIGLVVAVAAWRSRPSRGSNRRRTRSESIRARQAVPQRAN